MGRLLFHVRYALHRVRQFFANDRFLRSGFVTDAIEETTGLTPEQQAEQRRREWQRERIAEGIKAGKR